MQRILAILVPLLATACEPTVCGYQRVGGGELELRLLADDGEPYVLLVPGAQQLGEHPDVQGAWLARSTTERPDVVRVNTEVGAEQAPCGWDRADVYVFLDLGGQGARLEIVLGDGQGEFVDIFERWGATAPTRDGPTAGSWVGDASAMHDGRCPPEVSPWRGGVTSVSVTWDFDPTVVADDLEPSVYGRCPNDLP